MVICEKCGTEDCISSEEYRKHITITGAGVLSVPSSIIMKSCKARQQINILKEIKDNASRRVIRQRKFKI